MYQVQEGFDGKTWLGSGGPVSLEWAVNSVKRHHDDCPAMWHRVVDLEVGMGGDAVVFSIPSSSKTDDPGICKVERLARLLRQDLTGVSASVLWRTSSERDLHRQAVERIYDRLREPGGK